MDERGASRERRLQNVVFLGALLILVLVLGTSWLLQQERRRQEQQALALRLATSTIAPPTPTSTIAPTATLPDRVTADPRLGIPPPRSPSPTPVPTVTPLPTVPPPEVLPGADPADMEIAQFIYERHVADPYHRGSALSESYVQIDRQDVDLDGDGRPEILVSGGFGGTWVYAAVLGWDGEGWREWFFTSAGGRYGAAVRVSLEGDRIVADFVTRGGGTGLLTIAWYQDWIECQAGGCTVIWSGWRLWADWMAPFDCHNGYDYTVAEIEQLDDEFLSLVYHAFYASSFLPEELGPAYSPDYCRSRSSRSSGPSERLVYRWDGESYVWESIQEIASKTGVVEEAGPRTRRTIELVDAFLGRPGEDLAWAVFWGDALSSSLVVSPCTSGWFAPSVAAHSGSGERLGEWVAGLTGAEGCSRCRLVVQHLAGEGFELIGTAALSCTINLSRLDWADVTGDGREELLLLTLPPDKWVGANRQIVHVYQVGSSLVPLARLRGAFNGPDGAGVRWQDLDGDGAVELLTGLPLIDFDIGFEPDAPWPVLERRFQVYRWDESAGALRAGEVIVVPWGE